MEKVAGVVDRFCTFPVLERPKLFERTLFSFLVGNEDMHLILSGQLRMKSQALRRAKEELAQANQDLEEKVQRRGGPTEIGP